MTILIIGTVSVHEKPFFKEKRDKIMFRGRIISRVRKRNEIGKLHVGNKIFWLYSTS